MMILRFYLLGDVNHELAICPHNWQCKGVILWCVYVRVCVPQDVYIQRQTKEVKPIVVYFCPLFYSPLSWWFPTVHSSPCLFFDPYYAKTKQEFLFDNVLFCLFLIIFSLLVYLVRTPEENVSQLSNPGKNNFWEVDTMGI